MTAAWRWLFGLVYMTEVLEDGLRALGGAYNDAIFEFTCKTAQENGVKQGSGKRGLCHA
jgi:hypothetical protein